jgi:hypothetical protein
VLNKHHSLRTYGGNGGVAPRICNLGTRWSRVVNLPIPNKIYCKNDYTCRDLVNYLSHRGEGSLRT